MTSPVTTTIQPGHTKRAPGAAADWLLGDSGVAILAVDRVLTGRTAPGPRPLGRLSQVARAAAGREIVTALRAALPGQVVDLLIAGWRKHRSLVTAAAATAGHPDAERLVTLAEHQIRSVHEPTVDVIVDGIHVLTLFWRLDIVFDVGEVIAVVRGGRLVALRAGDAKLTGTLAVEGVEITRRSVVIPLTSVLDPGTGVDLTAPPADGSPEFPPK